MDAHTLTPTPSISNGDSGGSSTVGMFRFVFKRLLLSPSILLGANVVIFALVHPAPSGPVWVMLGPLNSEELARQTRLEMGFNRLLYVQYGLWMLDAFQDDLGVSWMVQQGTSVTDIIVERIPLTVELSILSMITAILIVIPAGIISVVRKDKSADHTAYIAALPGILIPDLWLGIVLTMIFAAQFSFPWTTGGWTPPWVDPAVNLQQLFLPIITFGTVYSAFIARMMRSEALDTLSQGYVKTARAMGTGMHEIVLKNVSKGTLIPVVMVVSVGLGQLMNDAILAEMMFSLSGIGKLLTLIIDRRDYHIIQALILFIASVFVFTNLAVGVLYAYLDSHIRHDRN